jgi:hypothetical protein
MLGEQVGWRYGMRRFVDGTERPLVNPWTFAEKDPSDLSDGFDYVVEPVCRVISPEDTP